MSRGWAGVLEPCVALTTSGHIMRTDGLLVVFPERQQAPAGRPLARTRLSSIHEQKIERKGKKRPRKFNNVVRFPRVLFGVVLCLSRRKARLFLVTSSPGWYLFWVLPLLGATSFNRLPACFASLLPFVSCYYYKYLIPIESVCGFSRYTSACLSLP